MCTGARPQLSKLVYTPARPSQFAGGQGRTRRASSRGAPPRLSAFALVVLLGLLGALASPVAAQTPPSTDATLSGLELSEGRLDPSFASGTTDYAAAVGYTVTRITVVPTTTDANATVAYLDGSDMPLPDANTVTDEQDVDLVVGVTTIKLKVTAEDTSTVNTYTVTITRTEKDTSLSPPASDPVAASPSTAVYDVVFQGAWTTAATPGGVPSGAHFSRLIGGVHSDAVTFLESSGTASAGVESMAEVGGWTGLQGEVQNAGSGALSVLAGDTDSISPTTSKTLTATLTTEHPRITLVTMVAPSPDWFVGVSGLPLLDDQGRWLRAHDVHLYPWDAGTEDGSEFSLSNAATSPQGVITSIRGTGKFSTKPIASLSFALRSVSTTRSVAENTAAGVDIGSPVTATAVGGAVTYTLGGTDAASFDIVAETGQLQTKAALDYETRSSYEVTVTATDADGSVTSTVAIEVTNVAELAAITGLAAITFAENGAGRVATYTASSEEDQDGVVWTVAGTDSAHFTIGTPGGALRFHIDPIDPSIFPKLPDFESPDDADADNDYEIILLARAGATISTPYAVTVTVTAVDEAGAISLSSARPKKDSALTATLNDPDGVTAGTAVWQWERSTGRNAWAVIEGAAAASYTPVAADTNTFLRVTATYADEHGTGKTVSEVVPNVVTGPLLTGLTAETDDSQAAPARGLYPAFDPLTLHYGIGCNNTDTLVLTVSAAANARMAVAGVQAASAPEAVSVAVSTDSDVAIRVTDASGAGTTYVVHCLPEVFFAIEVHTFPNTDAFEDLILFNREDYFRLMDRNGVPRLHLDLGSGSGTFAVRFHRVGADGAYRYGFWAGSDSYTILDEDFEVVDDDVSTVAPLTRHNSHDFQILEDGNYLVMAYERATRDFSDIDLPYFDGADVSSVGVNDAAVQIVTPGRRAVFTWNSWGNMAIEDCVQHRFPVTLSTDPDMRSPNGGYAHINGMHMVDGVIAASLRGCSKVLGIDVATGDVVWRMGRTNLSDAEWTARDIGPRPLDFINDPEGEFCGQHTARFLPNGNVFLFDNGSVCVIDPWTFDELGREGYDFSRAVEYALDLENHEAVFVRDHSLRGERSHLGYANGNVDVLDNGDWLVSWGRPLDVNVPIPDNERATLVDPATGQEKLGIRFRELPANERDRRINATVAPAEALAPQPVPLTAEFPASDHTSLFHTGSGDAPQVIVAFNQPVVDFSASSPSISVTGATVASVSAHVVAGEPASAYLVTLTPNGDGAITFRLNTGQACGDGGICTADGTTLSEAPSALVIGPAVTVSFEQATHTVTEGASRSVAVRLSSAHQGVRSVTIPVVLQTTGSASADDLTLDESVTFEAGETRKTLTVNALDDALVEGDEAATLEFGALPDGVTAGSTSTVTLTLTDADQADISFSVGANQIAEGGQTQLTFAFVSAVTFEVDQTINLTVGGTATEGDDFTLVDAGNQTLSAPYVVMFPAGATSTEATIRAVDDADIEHVAETITVSAQLGLTGTTLGTHTVTIPPSDVPGTPVVTIALGSPGSGVVEGTDATFTLSRTASTNLPLSDPLTVSVDVTATGSTLGGSPPTTVRFEGGAATANLAVLTLDDSVVEPPGTVTALIQGSTTNPPVYLTSAINSATVTVTDNDMAVFMFSAGATEVAEGSTVRLTILADGVTFAEPQTITLTLGGTATPADDFTLSDGGRELLAPYEVTLPAHAGAVTVTVHAARDDEPDAAETIEVSASHDGTVIGSVSITITEVPLPPVIFTGGGGGGASGPTPSDLDFEWNVTRDIEELDTGHDDPTGAWSDGVTLWLLDNGSGADDAVYAYDLASGERREDLEFELDDANLAPRGLWSDGSTAWISDSGKDKLFAHDLASGERLPERDIALAARNRAARGIWSADETMWVLDGGKDALFAYDLASGELLAEYELVSANGDPHGLWSDGVTVWVSDHGAKRLFAYRLPVPDAEEVDGEDLELERVRDEEFPNTILSRASNNSPRGLWSDGDVMYVVDASDGKVYTYNMPDAIDARLASLTLSGVDIGEFSPNREEYEGVVDDGVTVTTIEAAATQDDAVVVIDPPDADEAAEGRQVAVGGGAEITVTVTSADGSRKKTYSVRIKETGPSATCLRGAIDEGFSLVVSEGGSIDDLEACAEGRAVTALYTLSGGEYVSYILGAPPTVNERFVALYADGLTSLTPLIAKSEGPPSPAPESDDVPEFGPDCLRGEIVEGFNLVLYEGGSVGDLEACAQSLDLDALYTLHEGAYVSYIPGAPDFVNEAFVALFAESIAPVTPLIAKRD